MTMTADTKWFLENYNLEQSYIDTLNRENIEDIEDKVSALDKELFAEVDDLFNRWVDGEKCKRELNKVLKRANLTIEEYDIWCTL